MRVLVLDAEIQYLQEDEDWGSQASPHSRWSFLLVLK
jgi:hypothetical protein